ncbi:MAG: PEP-CTERM sorting domain-containing protein [Thermoguttaceae bacterium]|nr:PEP-CTERM sorting domain-containing protein [Thermoguttaceae bacterium]MDW8039444.1 PEP-CTERM sorting domain-containing protein [Thermoguttaceae bacterium]
MEFLQGAAFADPLMPHQLQNGGVYQFSQNLNSTYNARLFGDYIYASQINSGSQSIARYRWGSTTAVQERSFGAPEHRMNAPFPGATPSYLLAADGATDTRSLYLYNINNYTQRVSTLSPFNVSHNSFDWVDADTIIAASYLPDTTRKNLYLIDINVTGDPFSGGSFTASVNTTWNANGYVTTPVSTRIRNVRVGKTYTGYAYYGDAGVNNNPKFYAINLATGVSTELGGAGQLSGSGSFGVWTVVEAGGYLYVQTTDNGIQVYKMLDATTLGPLVYTYSKSLIDSLFPGQSSSQYWGFDVSPDGMRMVLSGASGRTYLIFGVPEPSSWLLMLLAGAGWLGWRRFQPAKLS